MPSWTFLRVVDRDLATIHRWMNEPGVVRFWEGDDVSWPAIIAQFGSPALRMTLAEEYPNFDYDEVEADFDAEHLEVYIGSLASEPLGWIQCYAVDDYEDEEEVQAWFRLGFDRTGAGIDYLIGESSERKKGLGSSMIRAFVDEIVFGNHPTWTRVGASPVRENAASCRALLKAGLTMSGSFDDADYGPCDLYARGRTSR